MARMDYRGNPLDQLEGNGLKQMMAEKKVTIDQLSKSTGLSRRTIQRLRANGSGTLASWRKIARALGCRIDDIAG